MKHILKKINIAGAGKKSKPEVKPASLNPPIYGEINLAASYSYAETLDLISDGPIEGLVNKDGLVLTNNTILQGIYLDGTVVQEPNNAEAEAASSVSLDFNVGGIDPIPQEPLFTEYVLDKTKTAEVIKNVFLNIKNAPDLALQQTAPSELAAARQVWALYGYTTGAGFDNNMYKTTNRIHMNGDWGITRATNSQGKDVINGGAVYKLEQLNIQNTTTVPIVNPYFPNTIIKKTNDNTLSFNDFGLRISYGTPVARMGSGPLANKRARAGMGFFDISRWNLHSSTLTTYITEIKNLYNSGNVYQKDYINKLFKRRIGDNWLSLTVNDLTNTFINKYVLTNTNDDMMLVIMKPPADQLGININLKQTSSNNQVRDLEFRLKDSQVVNLESDNGEITYCDFLVPVINANGYFTGQVKGCYALMIKLKYHFHADSSGNTWPEFAGVWPATPVITHYNYAVVSYSLKRTTIDILTRADSLILSRLDTDSVNDPIIEIDPTQIALANQKLNTFANNYYSKYNYSDFFAEARYGKEYQLPFQYFNKIYIDKYYESALLGPFRINNNQIQKIYADENVIKQKFNYSRNTNPFETLDGLAVNEGSNDNRGNYDYGNWNNKNENYNEIANPIVHIIENPNVDSVFISLKIDQLYDTAMTPIQLRMPASANILRNTLQSQIASLTPVYKDIGSNYPAIVNIEIETGLINIDGDKTNIETYQYQIVSLILSQTIVDIGNPELRNYRANDYSFITPMNGHLMSDPFELPKINDIKNEDKYKRYIKVKKLSTETNSTLVKKTLSLYKVTEIIDTNLTYPFSAIVATKIDSRTFSSVPNRIYDCKLKKVKVPKNYEARYANGKDKRYFNTVSDFNSTSAANKRIYVGDWDGTFKDNVEWTDNPAWILYDILTSTRYGLGQYLDISQIDIWELYQIGRFCDAVDDNGYFIGVPDGAGGLEPRFSCNILFQEGIKIFDAINTIAALFRGMVYHYNSEINFVDDRPKLIKSLFTNANVKDGLFSYSNYTNNERYNSIEVIFIDRFNNFETKIEYVEDAEDILKRGTHKKTINALGVSSRAMARRIGQHLIYQTIKENESVSFSTGTEALLCRPGDLIIVEDELRSLKSNFGKILDVDALNGTIRLNESFSSEDFNNKLTVYTPTGLLTMSQINEENALNQVNQNENLFKSSKTNPPQITTFGITGIEIKDYGCEAYVSENDMNYSLLKFIPLGSTYRFQRKNSDDQLYKILKITEENPNEYLISANKYDTGKWSLIENGTSVESSNDTYSYQVTQNINGRVLETLSTPEIKYLSTGFNNNGELIISGRWTSNNKATGYNVKLVYPNGNYIQENISSTGYSNVINSVGNYALRVNAKGNSSSIASNPYVYYDSQYDSSGIFVMFDGAISTNYDRSFVKSIKIL
jgi:hypothetical protein